MKVSNSHAGRRSRRWRAASLSTGVALLALAGVSLVSASAASAASNTIVGAASNRCIDLPGMNTANGTQLNLWDCNGGANQAITATSSGQLQVMGKCLDAEGYGRTAGTRVILWDCSGTPNQQWTISGGKITGVDSSLCLDATGQGTANGTKIQLWTCNGQSNQSWETSVSTGTGGGTTTTTAPSTPQPTPTTSTSTSTSTSTTAPTTGGTNGAPAGTPVALHGQLHVCGTKICDVHNSVVQLKGISSMWLNYEAAPYAENYNALKWMRDNWKISIFRIAMGVEPSGAYANNPGKADGQVEQTIKNAQSLGIYVIVDFHADHANQYQSQSISFFKNIAGKYGSSPNVLYEDWNEPNAVSWSQVIKPYHQAVVSAIRSIDPDNIIIMGTSTWSQDVDTAANDRVSGTNLMYTLHFYSCTHQQSLRDRATTALNAGLPIFITEWGASDASGGTNGVLCTAEAQKWLDWAKSWSIGWAAWKLDACDQDSTCLLRAGAPVDGNWNNWLHGQASFVVQNLKA